MAQFYNPRSKVLVSVADDFDRSSWAPWWVQLPAVVEPTPPAPTGIEEGEWKRTLLTTKALREWDAAKAAREAAELAADARPMAEVRARAAAAAVDQSREDAEKDRLRRVAFAQIAEVNQRTWDRVVH